MTKHDKETPHYKRVSKSGKRYDSSKTGWTRYTVHIEENTLKAFKRICAAEGITHSEAISEAVKNWIAR